MSVSNPNDDSLQAQIDELRELLRANPLRSASVEAGRTRYYGGSELLIQDSNLSVVGTATITGSANIFGVLRVVGRAIVEGLGVLVVTSLLDLLGMLRVRNGGGITVEDGGDIVVNGGEIRADDIVMRDGKIFVGTGANQIVIDSATGRVIAGNVVVEPDKITIGGDTPATLEDGEFTLGNGAKLQVGLTGGTSSIGLVPQGGAVDISANQFTAWMRALGASISVNTSQARIDAPLIIFSELPVADSIEGLEWVAHQTSTGRLFRVPPGVGGPGGDFEWPYDLGLVTSEFGVRVHPVTGETTMHNGIDFGPPAGTPIPSIGRGTVTTSQNSGGFGNLVVVDHGTVGGHHVESYYAHMQAPGVAVGTTVATGGILGNVGSTGLSTGPHLHLEIHVDGVAVNPRDFMAQYDG